MTLYTTYFDSNFLVRGLACLRSLARHSTTQTKVLVLALDSDCAKVLQSVGPVIAPGLEVEVMTVEEIEAKFPALCQTKAGRFKIEYYFTLTPFLCDIAMERVSPGEKAVYIDADLYFFADSEEAVRACGSAHVAVVEHRFPGRLSGHAAAYGRFNVGWLAFERSDAARICIEDWKLNCLAWCGDEPDARGFADQKYLDRWPDLTESLTVLDHPGVNLAPWNVGRHELSPVGDSTVTVDGRPLIVFHFHHLQRITTDIYDADYAGFGKLPGVLKKRVYSVYVRELASIEREVAGRWKWTPEAPLVRFTQRERSFKSLALFLLSIWRIFSGERVLIQDGKIMGAMRSLRYV